MDFQALADSYSQAAVVISVEKKGDGQYGDIRFVAGNAAYIAVTPNFHPNALYSDVIPKEPNFEDFCYRCAVQKKHLHAYVDTKSMGVWVDGTYIPLNEALDTEELSYLVFTMYFTTKPEADRMADISAETSIRVVKTCINLRESEQYTENMNKVVSDIQMYTESFCSCIMMVDTEKQKVAALAAKYRNDEAKFEDFAPYLTYDVVSSWLETCEKRDIIILKNDFDMDELQKINPLWVESLRTAGVKSLIFVPLRKDKKTLGFLFITNFNTENIIAYKEYIQLTSFFLSSEIANNNLMEQLEYLSNVDSLTGVNNRNAMNTRVDYHVKNVKVVKSPFGIVFADLNGLKKCNDTGGHEAGDRLLKDAAHLISSVFEGCEIYRSGGDEFVVIEPGCEKASFEEKVSRLRKLSGDDSSVCLAIGAQWTDGEISLRKCMHIADTAMYADKEEYYKTHAAYR